MTDEVPNLTDEFPKFEIFVASLTFTVRVAYTASCYYVYEQNRELELDNG